METQKIINLLQHPEKVDEIDLSILQSITKEYPYFQSIKAIELKSLKKNNSFSYNQKLKETAAYTTDRSVLFEFITSSIFNSNKENTSVDVTENNTKFDSNQNKDISSHTHYKPSNNPANDGKTEIQPNAPLDFTTTETHSFSEWLKLTSAQPIVRVPKEKAHHFKKKKLIESPLIDRFIKNNPKIKPVKKTVQTVSIASHQDIQPENLMTETLAKVYIAQKNYKKAIQAYKILSLKNPEKSGLFADQIRAIKKLQDNNQ